MKIKQKIVGVFPCGSEDVQLILREGSGADFWFTPEPGSVARIKVGVDYSWDAVVCGLLHEAFEMQMARLGCRYDPTNDYGKDHSSYLFVMNHPQFSNVCGRVAQFMVAALPELKRAHRAWMKRGRR